MNEHNINKQSFKKLINALYSSIGVHKDQHGNMLYIEDEIVYLDKHRMPSIHGWLIFNSLLVDHDIYLDRSLVLYRKLLNSFKQLHYTRFLTCNGVKTYIARKIPYRKRYKQEVTIIPSFIITRSLPPQAMKSK